MTDWLRVTIEYGRGCGLETVGEAIDNMLLHYPFSRGDGNTCADELADWDHAVNSNDTLDWAESLDAVFYFDRD